MIELRKIIDKLIELDESVVVKLHAEIPETRSFIILHKDYSEDEFFQKYISVYEVLDWVKIFGLEMTCKDILEVFYEEMKECYG